MALRFMTNTGAVGAFIRAASKGQPRFVENSAAVFVSGVIAAPAAKGKSHRLTAPDLPPPGKALHVSARSGAAPFPDHCLGH
jgi:hypothetical protein